MDFGLDLRKILRPDEFGFTVVRSREVARAPPEIARIINTMGQRSTTAQGLGGVITTTEKFIMSTDNVLYIKSENNKVVGFLKTGYKHLFQRNLGGRIIEITPLCVLDFYVHESMQRGGHGRELFERMLFEEQMHPSKLAIDAPSTKLIAFLRKHYCLANYVPQNHNFVVFNEYFEKGLKYVPYTPEIREPPAPAAVPVRSEPQRIQQNIQEPIQQPRQRTASSDWNGAPAKPQVQTVGPPPTAPAQMAHPQTGNKGGHQFPSIPEPGQRRQLSVEEAIHQAKLPENQDFNYNYKPQPPWGIQNYHYRNR